MNPAETLEAEQTDEEAVTEEAEVETAEPEPNVYDEVLDAFLLYAAEEAARGEWCAEYDIIMARVLGHRKFGHTYATGDNGNFRFLLVLKALSQKTITNLTAEQAKIFAEMFGVPEDRVIDNVAANYGEVIELPWSAGPRTVSSGDVSYYFEREIGRVEDVEKRNAIWSAFRNSKSNNFSWRYDPAREGTTGLRYIDKMHKEYREMDPAERLAKLVVALREAAHTNSRAQQFESAVKKSGVLTKVELPKIKTVSWVAAVSIDPVDTALRGTPISHNTSQITFERQGFTTEVMTEDVCTCKDAVTDETSKAIEKAVKAMFTKEVRAEVTLSSHKATCTICA